MGMLQNKMIEQMTLAGFSKRTVKNYVYFVKSLVVHFQKSPDKISSQEISCFLLFVREEKKYSGNTMNICYSAIQFFYKHVLHKPDYMKNIPKMKRGKSKPVVLDVSEVEKLINVATNIKYKTLFSIIYSAGLRIGEAVNLTIKDIDLHRNL
jgi:site-specific recombinase XerD